jgi:glycine dehydrogenase
MTAQHANSTTNVKHNITADDFTDFVSRHIGPNQADLPDMLKAVACTSLDQFMGKVIPDGFQATTPINLPEPSSEYAILADLEEKAARNKIFTSYLGMGYHDVHMPSVIERVIFQNPGWYTAYTPYQAEISQGRLEMLLNFQQMIMDFTGLPYANASLLDEATAAAEAMSMMHRISDNDRTCFLVDQHCRPFRQQPLFKMFWCSYPISHNFG